MSMLPGSTCFLAGYHILWHICPCFRASLGSWLTTKYCDIYVHVTWLHFFLGWLPRTVTSMSMSPGSTWFLISYHVLWHLCPCHLAPLGSWLATTYCDILMSMLPGSTCFLAGYHILSHPYVHVTWIHLVLGWLPHTVTSLCPCYMAPLVSWLATTYCHILMSMLHGSTWFLAGHLVLCYDITTVSIWKQPNSLTLSIIDRYGRTCPLNPLDHLTIRVA